MKLNGKRVLVTGGAGFIGSNLSRKLMKRNNYVVCVDDLSFGKREKIHADETYVYDVSSEKFRKSLMGAEFDVVFHFGAPCTVRQFQDNPILSVKKTLIGYENILSLAEGCDAKLVYPSSGNVYGDSENSELSRPNPNNLYAICKYTTEKLARRSKTSNVGLRIFAGYGRGEEHKGDYASVVSIFFYKMLKGERPIIWGDGSQNRDFIHIDDITDGIILAAESPMTYPVINLGTGKSTNFNQIVDAINDVLQTDIKPKYVKKPKNYVETTKANVSRMKKHLGLRLRSLSSGIQEYLNI